MIERRGDSWRARFHGPDGRERNKSFARKSDAERWLAQQRSFIAQDDWIDPARGRITFGEYALAWLDSRTDLKPKTRHQYSSLLTLHVLPTWRTVPLAKITFEGLSQWVARLSLGDLGPSGDPAVGVRHVRRARSRRAQRAYPLQPRSRAWACPGHAAATTCSSLTASSAPWPPKPDPGGCSSWCSATRDCAGARPPPCVSAISTWPAAGSMYGGPSLTSAAMSSSALRSRISPGPSRFPGSWPASCQRPSAGKHADDLVFTMPSGSVLRLSNWRRATFLPARARAGLSSRFRIHDLRHTAASLMIQAGYPPKMLQEIMGHASITTTLDLYGHLYPGDMDRYADRLDSAAEHHRSGHNPAR